VVPAHEIMSKLMRKKDTQKTDCKWPSLPKVENEGLDLLKGIFREGTLVGIENPGKKDAQKGENEKDDIDRNPGRFWFSRSRDKDDDLLIILLTEEGNDAVVRERF